MSARIASFTLLLAAISIAGCDLLGSEEEAAEASVTGTFRTTVFQVTYEDGETVDIAEHGGFIEMTLDEGRGVSGHLFIPRSALREEDLEPGQEGDVDIRFGGTYEVRGDTITFDHEADTFIRDDAWVFADGQLRDVGDFPGTVVLIQE